MPPGPSMGLCCCLDCAVCTLHIPFVRLPVTWLTQLMLAGLLPGFRKLLEIISKYDQKIQHTACLRGKKRTSERLALSGFGVGNIVSFEKADFEGKVRIHSVCVIQKPVLKKLQKSSSGNPEDPSLGPRSASLRGLSPKLLVRESLRREVKTPPTVSPELKNVSDETRQQVNLTDSVDPVSGQ
ncbi:hypothetical protein CB1_000318003 [Camelus ferus]|nr:hypothetical protein CB1_000318003 [Camelus ferus]